MKYTFKILGLSILIISCTNPSAKKLEELKAEVFQTELNFAEMANRQGLQAAFLHFAADNAVLSRNNKVIHGKSAIKEYFESQTLKNVNLQWKPDFIDVSKSGDMAYTYGKYTMSAISPEGDSINAQGIFHTVWKKQKDNSWKFVWD